MTLKNSTLYRHYKFGEYSTDTYIKTKTWFYDDEYIRPTAAVNYF